MIHRIGVVGAGTMGLGIAQLCAQSGFSVKIFDDAAAARESVPKRLRQAIDHSVLRGKLTTDQGQRAFYAVTVVQKLEDMAGADLVIEAIAEDLAAKKELFGKLDAICADAVLATNTSSLSVAAIAGAVRTPHRVLGIHFFNPPVAMKLVELVRAPKTSDLVFGAVWDFMIAGLRKTPVDVKDTPGFIVNRVMRPYYLEAQRCAGAGYAHLDAAAREIGKVPMGPFELMDLIGLDVNLAITKLIYAACGKPERFAPPSLQQKLVDAGHTGRKAGKGFYLYDKDKALIENPEAVRAKAGAEPMSGEQGWSRVIGAVIEEAERVRDEKVAGVNDIDTAIRLAMNFPRGPLAWRAAAQGE